MIETRYHTQDDNLIIERVQDFGAVLKSVKQHKEVMSSKPVDGLGYYVGEIPGLVIEQYMKAHGVSYAEFINNDEHVNRIVKDPNYKDFRVWEGRI